MLGTCGRLRTLSVALTSLSRSSEWSLTHHAHLHVARAVLAAIQRRRLLPLLQLCRGARPAPLAPVRHSCQRLCIRYDIRNRPPVGLQAAAVDGWVPPSGSLNAVGAGAPAVMSLPRSPAALAAEASAAADLLRCSALRLCAERSAGTRARIMTWRWKQTLSHTQARAHQASCDARSISLRGSNPLFDIRIFCTSLHAQASLARDSLRANPFRVSKTGRAGRRTC